jgi:nicotinamide mononucleotide transporter
MTLYGWYHWVFGKEGRRQLAVSHIKPALLVALIIAGALGSALAGYLFSTYTNASLPYWDAAVAVWGVIATYAMARKIIENWIMWIITDAVCVGIYFYKELFAFTVLYFIFTVLAAYGYYKWSKDYKSLRAIS